MAPSTPNRYRAFCVLGDGRVVAAVGDLINAWFWTVIAPAGSARPQSGIAAVQSGNNLCVWWFDAGGSLRGARANDAMSAGTEWANFDYGATGTVFCKNAGRRVVSAVSLSEKHMEVYSVNVANLVMNVTWRLP